MVPDGESFLWSNKTKHRIEPLEDFECTVAFKCYRNLAVEKKHEFTPSLLPLQHS